MSETQTITDIRNIKNTIKEEIKKVEVANYQGQEFGNEGEYTYKGLLGGRCR